MIDQLKIKFLVQLYFIEEILIRIENCKSLNDQFKADLNEILNDLYDRSFHFERLKINAALAYVRGLEESKLGMEYLRLIQRQIQLLKIRL